MHIQRPALIVEILKQPTQHDFALNHAAMRNRELWTVYVETPNGGVNKPVAKLCNHSSPSGMSRPGNTLFHSCSNRLRRFLARTLSAPIPISKASAPCAQHSGASRAT